jgi:hypothetical protein
MIHWYLNNPRFIVITGVISYLAGVVAFVGSVAAIWQGTSPVWYSGVGMVSVCLLFLLKVRAMEVRKAHTSH